MVFVEATPLSLSAFLAVVIAVLAAFIWALYRARQLKWAFAFVAALGILAFIVGTGWVEAAPMPRLLLLFFGVNMAWLAVALSPLGRALAENVPLRCFILFQAFRFPLELVLHSWAAQGVIPSTMTWALGGSVGAGSAGPVSVGTGSAVVDVTQHNFDIITGLLSLFSFWFVERYRGLAWGVNLIGFALLLNVMRVAMMSSPLPFAWPVEPPLQLGFHLPYALIVPVCVGGALGAHIITFRALLLRR